ncbi:exodeoxyribonuclease VII small subunit [Ampullimonas aquatilis]|uniref:exodeoxyribonuclease VII small subunit n=1 Tax=Ampullimonas aquatilis TaxID=1341549 RepID=UPI003C720DD3
MSPSKKTTVPDTASDQAPSFEQAMTELEQLVAKMENGELTLEQSLQAYERGALLVKNCQQALAKVEAQVKVLEGDLLKSFDDSRVAE